MSNKDLPFLFASSFFALFLSYAALHSNSFAQALLLIVLLILVILGLLSNFSKFDTKSFSLIEALNIIYAHVIGSVATFLLVQHLHFSNVVAAAFIGLMGYFASIQLTRNKFIDLAPNFYCGAFVGMVSTSVLTTQGVMGAGLISGLLFIFLASRLNGCGGKLGSIAFMSCVITIGILKLL